MSTASRILPSLSIYSEYAHARSIANLRRAEWRANMASQSALLRYSIALEVRNGARAVLAETLADAIAEASSGERMRCDSCDACMINGRFCHETGCPNIRARYDDGEWIKQYRCFHCGYMADVGEVCCE